MGRAQLWLAAAGALCCAQLIMAQPHSPKPDINTVLAAHDTELLRIPGVTGVYVGVLHDGKTPCLRIMLKERTPAIERALPRELDGYPVATEVSGEIRPLGRGQ